ncbi:zona pellucida sperm-binding protein 2-like isoform X1 [Ranitomeya variabilis]|uniref:zona pellucida sperm-binding protein 2-like isoform X1 n=1 Tax=Ranitomeya variabilis TaxID=490064 RepID=UPI004056EFD1
MTCGRSPLLLWLAFLTSILATEVCTQGTSSDLIISSCRRSLVQLDLPARNVFKKYVRFSAIDPAGMTHEITDAVATKCGYTTSYDDWGNITFRTSFYSCYVQIVNDTYYTISVKIEIASRHDMVNALSYMKVVSCPYVWNPREIICETNYMEVSVRRKIPVISEGVFRNEPEDWSTAFPQAVSGLMSVWQVVFHLSSTLKSTMLIDAAQDIGYGINTTESRVLLRAPYNASQAVPQRINGVTFSTVRATLFYKQRWFIYLVDNAIACPVDDVRFVSGSIVWSVQKNISPLLTGSKTIQNSLIQFGVDLLNLTDAEILSRQYEIVDSNTATNIRIPVGAEGGYYKSHVVNSQYGITYNICPFLENLWLDDSWGITKYTIIKDITTPFAPHPPVVSNETILTTLTFNITVGTFLPDVLLINLTIGGITLPVPEAVNLGYVIENKTLPNGNVTFILKVPFGDDRVTKETVPDGILFTLNVTFGFLITPNGETFTTPATIDCLLRQPTIGPCGQKGGMLTTTLGNLDPSWLIYINNVQATLSNGLLSNVSATHSTVEVPAASNLVMDEVTSAGFAVIIPISIRDQDGNEVSSVVISCDPQSNPVVCLSDGTMEVSVKKLWNIPDMDLSRLVLRDASCRPVVLDGIAKFVLSVKDCRTTRRFEGNLMIYENDVTYSSISSGKILFTMYVTCNYTTNSTLVVDYSYEDNPTPSAQTGIAPLDLVLRLSKSDGYNVFYEDTEYPVIKYLREPLYFEVELLHSSDPRLELFLDSCWATTTPDMRSFPTWPIINNSCEHNEPYLTIFHPVRTNARVQFPSHLKRFEVKTFTFMDGGAAYSGEIYFHCDVIICDSSNLASDPVCTQMGSCIPARQRLGRSVDAASDEHRWVSSGELFLLPPKMRADASSNLQ